MGQNFLNIEGINRFIRGRLGQKFHKAGGFSMLKEGTGVCSSPRNLQFRTSSEEVGAYDCFGQRCPLMDGGFSEHIHDKEGLLTGRGRVTSSLPGYIHFSCTVSVIHFHLK